MLLSSALSPLAAAAGGIGVLSAMDGLIKYVSAEHATAQIVMLRYAFGALSAFLVFRAAGTRWPSLAAVKPHAWRAIVICITALTFFYALATLPLAVTLALSFTSPIFIALLARLSLGERPGGRVAAALGIGFAGVLVVLGGEIGRAGEASALGIAAAITSSLSYAASMVAMKHRTAHDPITTIVLLQNVLTCLLIMPAGALAWSTPALVDIAVFVLIGVLGTAGHLLMAFAYGRAEASRLGVMEYTSFIWAALIGLIAFGEVPSAATIAGAVLIVAGALLVSRPAHQPAPEAEIGP